MCVVDKKPQIFSTLAGGAANFCMFKSDDGFVLKWILK
jgi:hypothetical protein